MPTPRRIALIAGALYLLTVITSIPALDLKEPALTDPGILGTPSGETALLWAAALEIVLAAACIGTAVVLYPITRRQSETAALGFVGARLVEGTLVTVGVLAMLSLIAVSRGSASVEPGSLGAADATLVAIHDAAFLLGPGPIPAANALLLGSVLYRSRLVPRILPVIGFVGAPLLIASVIATLFGAIDQVSPIAGIAALPIALWEISLGIWLVVKGFRPEALARLSGPAASAHSWSSSQT